MVITRNDAAQALADISNTERRGSVARTYRASGSILLLWGGIWIAAYTATGLLPPLDWWQAWLPGDLIGAVGTFWLCRDLSARKSTGTRAWLIGLAVAAFVVSLYAVHPPHTLREGEALPPLIVAFLYMVVGAGKLSRYALIGGTLFAATLFGFFALPTLFSFWLAGVGGGALIAGGLWLRSA